MSKSLEDKYKKLSHREHVLKRKNMYLGNPNTENVELFVVDDVNDISNDIKVVKKHIPYNACNTKLFDEAISNAGDFHLKTGKVTYIKVNITEEYISVENDGGGIPVELHPTENIYVPELIFGHLLTGDNYDDSEEKFSSGQNGIGIKAVNILSKKFILETADGKKLYHQVFENNMAEMKPASITKSSKNYTKVTYYTDFNELTGITSNDDNVKSILLKRILDLSVYLPDVKFYYNGKLLKVKSMKDFMKLHLSPDAELFYEKLENGWEVGIAKSPSDIFEQVSICSSVSTLKGGTHVTYIANDVSRNLAELITKGSKKLNISWADVKNKIFLFLVAKVPNSKFDTQMKETLVNPMTKEITKGATVSEGTLKKIMKSEIVQSIMDYIEAKQMQELKKLNKSLQKTKVEKLIDAKGKNRDECILGLFEGDSATSFVRKFRDPNIFGAFPLRGKFLNVSELTNSTVIQNAEVQNLISSIGLHLGDKANINNMRYGKIYFYTDADTDGDSISGLLINFFYKYWKELFEEGRVFKVLTPLLVATKDKTKEYFYTQDEFDQWAKTINVNQWNIEYKKGLAALTDDEAKMILRDPNLVQLTPDKMAATNLDVWFGKDSGKRKDELMK